MMMMIYAILAQKYISRTETSAFILSDSHVRYPTEQFRVNSSECRAVLLVLTLHHGTKVDELIARTGWRLRPPAVHLISEHGQGHRNAKLSSFVHVCDQSPRSKSQSD